MRRLLVEKCFSTLEKLSPLSTNENLNVDTDRLLIREHLYALTTCTIERGLIVPNKHIHSRSSYDISFLSLELDYQYIHQLKSLEPDYGSPCCLATRCDGIWNENSEGTSSFQPDQVVGTSKGWLLIFFFTGIFYGVCGPCDEENVPLEFVAITEDGLFIASSSLGIDKVIIWDAVDLKKLRTISYNHLVDNSRHILRFSLFRIFLPIFVNESMKESTSLDISKDKCEFWGLYLLILFQTGEIKLWYFDQNFSNERTKSLLPPHLEAGCVAFRDVTVGNDKHFSRLVVVFRPPLLIFLLLKHPVSFTDYPDILGIWNSMIDTYHHYAITVLSAELFSCGNFRRLCVGLLYNSVMLFIIECVGAEPHLLNHSILSDTVETPSVLLPSKSKSEPVSISILVLHQLTLSEPGFILLGLRSGSLIIIHKESISLLDAYAGALRETYTLSSPLVLHELSLPKTFLFPCSPKNEDDCPCLVTRRNSGTAYLISNGYWYHLKQQTGTAVVEMATRLGNIPQAFTILRECVWDRLRLEYAIWLFWLSIILSVPSHVSERPEESELPENLIREVVKTGITFIAPFQPPDLFYTELIDCFSVGGICWVNGHGLEGLMDAVADGTISTPPGELLIHLTSWKNFNDNMEQPQEIELILMGVASTTGDMRVHTHLWEIGTKRNMYWLLVHILSAIKGQYNEALALAQRVSTVVPSLKWKFLESLSCNQTLLEGVEMPVFPQRQSAWRVVWFPLVTTNFGDDIDENTLDEVCGKDITFKNSLWESLLQEDSCRALRILENLFQNFDCSLPSKTSILTLQLLFQCAYEMVLLQLPPWKIHPVTLFSPKSPPFHATCLLSSSRFFGASIFSHIFSVNSYKTILFNVIRAQVWRFLLADCPLTREAADKEIRILCENVFEVMNSTNISLNDDLCKELALDKEIDCELGHAKMGRALLAWRWIRGDYMGAFLAAWKKDLIEIDPLLPVFLIENLPQWEIQVKTIKNDKRKYELLLRLKHAHWDAASEIMPSHTPAALRLVCGNGEHIRLQDLQTFWKGSPYNLFIIICHLLKYELLDFRGIFVPNFSSEGVAILKWFLNLICFHGNRSEINTAINYLAEFIEKQEKVHELSFSAQDVVVSHVLRLHRMFEADTIWNIKRKQWSNAFQSLIEQLQTTSQLATDRMQYIRYATWICQNWKETWTPTSEKAWLSLLESVISPRVVNPITNYNNPQETENIIDAVRFILQKVYSNNPKKLSIILRGTNESWIKYKQLFCYVESIQSSDTSSLVASLRWWKYANWGEAHHHLHVALRDLQRRIYFIQTPFLCDYCGVSSLSEEKSTFPWVVFQHCKHVVHEDCLTTSNEPIPCCPCCVKKTITSNHRTQFDRREHFSVSSKAFNVITDTYRGGDLFWTSADSRIRSCFQNLLEDTDRKPLPLKEVHAETCENEISNKRKNDKEMPLASDLNSLNELRGVLSGILSDIELENLLEDITR